MKRDQIIYPLCMDLHKPKATYITHDGYVRPCCFTHRHQKVEADERWMNDLKHNLKSGSTLQQIFETPEYKDFFERLRTGKQVPDRCIQVCKKSRRSWNDLTGGSYDTRKEKSIVGYEQYESKHNSEKYYEDSYSVKHKLQIDATHRCSLGCPKCNRFIEDFHDRYTNKKYDLGHQVLLKDDLSVEHFQAIIDEVRQVADKKENGVIPDIDFCGTWSDAIYHPDFLKLIKIAKDKNFNVSIVTNGSRKKQKWWDELYSMLNPKYDSFVFGMDGLKDTAHIYRKNILYDDVIYAMKKGGELGFSKSKWSFIVFNFNQHQVHEASELAKELGIAFEIVKSARWDGPDDPLMPSKEWLPESTIKEYGL